MPGGTPAHDPLSQVVPGKADMGDDYDAIVVQMTQLMEHSDPAQQPPWDGSGLAAEAQRRALRDNRAGKYGGVAKRPGNLPGLRLATKGCITNLKNEQI